MSAHKNPDAKAKINGKAQDKPSPATYEGLYPGPVTIVARIGTCWALSSPNTRGA